MSVMCLLFLGSHARPLVLPWSAFHGAEYIGHVATLALGGGGWVTITGTPERDDMGGRKGSVTRKMPLPGLWR